jgi:hypothetical protein
MQKGADLSAPFFELIHTSSPHAWQLRAVRGEEGAYFGLSSRCAVFFALDCLKTAPTPPRLKYHTIATGKSTIGTARIRASTNRHCIVLSLPLPASFAYHHQLTLPILL